MNRTVPVLRSLCAVLAAGATLLSAQDDSVVGRVREGLPSYDPHFGQAAALSRPAVVKEVESAETLPGHAPRPRLRELPPPKHVVEGNAAVLAGTDLPPQAQTAGLEAEDGDVVQLPEVTVEEKALPRLPLPRLPVDRPKQAVALDPFMTKAAQVKELEKKHLGAFDRLVLNRFQLLGSNARRALEAEEREQFALSMNELADAIEQSGLWGVSDEERKELRKQYYQLLVDGPK